jgi:hypothetical protein
MKARDVGDGGKMDATEVMVVPGGVLVRVTAACWHGAISTAAAFVPVAGADDGRTFPARLGCHLPAGEPRP